MSDDLVAPEIILNLWMIGTDDGWIGSLRVMPYLGTGSDRDKLAFLHSRSGLDFVVARMFKVPDAYHVHGRRSGRTVRSAYLPAVKAAGPTIALFTEALGAVQHGLPKTTPYDVPPTPLVCITYVARGADGVLRAQVDSGVG